jgi:hypothetical protein
METRPKKGKADAGQDRRRNLPERADLKGSPRFSTMIVSSWNPRGIQGCVVKESCTSNVLFIDFPETGGTESVNFLFRDVLKKGAAGRELKILPSTMRPPMRSDLVTTSPRFTKKLRSQLSKTRGAKRCAWKFPILCMVKPLLPNIPPAAQSVIGQGKGSKIGRRVILLNIPSQQDGVHS